MFDRRDRARIFVEAKRLSEDTLDHYEQLARYAEGATELVLVLTNGEYWNVCGVDRNGEWWEENPIGLLSRPVAESARRLCKLLSKDAVW